jgi:hypothetical protein
MLASLSGEEFERKQKDVTAFESRELYAARSGPSILGAIRGRRIEAATRAR